MSTKRTRGRSRPAFTLIEVAALSVVGAVGLAMSQPNLSAARSSARQIKDATQIRGIGMSLTMWAQHNRDEYVRPSKVDRDDATARGPAATKDTTAAVFSILIWNGFISPELCVSPVENNPNIKVDEDYQLSNPKGAPKPAEALWDPAFSADFTGGNTGNVSYAHQMIYGERLKEWANTFNAIKPVLANRGPEVTAAEYMPGDLVKPTLASPNSNTFTFFKDKGAWSGHVLFNDCHVEFIAKLITPGQPIATAATYVSGEGKKHPDIAFFDEPDDPVSANNYFSLFITAGAARGDFKAIWD